MQKQINITLLLLLFSLTGTVVECFFSVPSVPQSLVNPTQRTGGNTLSDQKILELAKGYVSKGNGFYSPIVEEIHADDFVFRGGVIGPLNKRDYCSTMAKLGVSEAFDLSPNAFGFCVDPDLPNAARFFVRYTGKQVKTWKVAGTPINIPVPTNDDDNRIVGPTESFLLQFNDEGKTKFFTISSPMLFGNPSKTTTGKYGAVLGLFIHVGFAVAADLALNSNVRVATNAIANLLPENMAPPKTASNPKEVPSWYTGL